jgi:hypothetical protein
VTIDFRLLRLLERAFGVLISPGIRRIEKAQNHPTNRNALHFQTPAQHDRLRLIRGSFRTKNTPQTPNTSDHHGLPGVTA